LQKSQQRQLTDEQQSRLWRALEASDIDELNRLCEGNVELRFTDTDGYTPLARAIQADNFDMVQLFLDNDPETILISCEPSFGNTPLHMAISKRSIDMINYLLGTGYNIIDAKNRQEQTPLMLAVQQHSMRIVEAILAFQPAIDLYDENGCSALMLAVSPSNLRGLSLDARNQSIEILLLLTQYPSIDKIINANDSLGCTALMYAVASRSIEAVNLLLHVPGIDVNAKNNEDETALVYAVRCRSIDILDLLLQVPGIDVNATDMGSNNVVMIAHELVLP